VAALGVAAIAVAAAVVTASSAQVSLSWAVVLEPAEDTCPVTRPSGMKPRGLRGDRWYGNGKLWVLLPPGGVLRVTPGQVNPDGSMFDKPGWVPTGVRGALVVRGRRIDGAAPPLRVHSVNWGHNTVTGRGSWRSAITYPTAGCWRLTGRVRDVTLSYVLKVERL
jgi:hypothetical protein